MNSKALRYTVGFSRKMLRHTQVCLLYPVGAEVDVTIKFDGGAVRHKGIVVGHVTPKQHRLDEPSEHGYLVYQAENSHGVYRRQLPDYRLVD